MKCIVCKAPNELQMREDAMPQRGEGQALVRIRRIGICGTDLHAYRGRQPFFVYPRVLGHELCVELVEADSDDPQLKPGTPLVVMPYISCGHCIACRRGRPNCCTQVVVLGVHEDGGMREYMSLPLSCLVPADGLELEQMALVECLSIGAHAVDRAAVEPGETALVIGGGPIGIGVMQFARIAGARVIAMDINKDRLAYCKDTIGVDETIHTESVDDPAAALAELTNGDLPTVVIDATGSPDSMIAAFNYVASSGRYVLVSIVQADISFYDPEFHRREIALLSSRNARREHFTQVIDALRRGDIETQTFVTHRVPFDDVIEAYPSWLKPETGVIKAMVELG